MPLMRGAVYALQQSGSAESRAVIVLTTDHWNAAMTQVGAVVVRDAPTDIEMPHAVALEAGGGHAIGSAVVSLDVPTVPGSVIGDALGRLSAQDLADVEDRVCSFLDLPRLVVGRPQRPELPGDATRYPVWGDLYYAGPLIEGERKRYAVVSPNRWNVVSHYVSVVRTTSRDKANVAAFPLIEGGAARASCGDLSVRAKTNVDLRGRPMPRALSQADMVAIAKGIVQTHGLDAAVARLSP